MASGREPRRDQRHDATTGDAELLRRKAAGFYNLHAKRPLGLLIALPLMVVFAPVMLIVSLAVAVDSGLPIFYRGERGGFRGRPFHILKFRSMVADAELVGGGTTALGDPRITRVGAFLRKTKLDEFPQLLNVIRGEMCFIGPRPELLRYTSQYSGDEKYILEVRPGITDFSSVQYINLAEVVGAHDADAVYEREVLRHKNRLRIQYVAKMSPATDLRLFVTTVWRAGLGVLRILTRRRRDGDR